MSRYNDENIPQELRRLIAAVLSYSAHEGRRLGLSLIEIAVMEHVSLAGELTPGQLGERLGLSSGTVTGVVDRLERAGYVVRERHPDDRRSIVIRPSGPQTAAVQEERGELSRALDALGAALSEQEQVYVARYLAGVADAIQNACS